MTRFFWPAVGTCVLDPETLIVSSNWSLSCERALPRLKIAFVFKKANVSAR